VVDADNLDAHRFVQGEFLAVSELGRPTLVEVRQWSWPA
jgi:hypothetical protein